MQTASVPLSMMERSRKEGRWSNQSFGWFATWGTADLRAIGLPVFSLGSIPTGPRRLDARPDDALGSSTVGDWTVGWDDVVGDDDGVVFVPAARAQELLDIAEGIRPTERRQADRMRAGESLRRQVRFDDFLAERERTPTLTFWDHLRAVGGGHRGVAMDPATSRRNP